MEPSGTSGFAYACDHVNRCAHKTSQTKLGPALTDEPILFFLLMFAQIIFLLHHCKFQESTDSAFTKKILLLAERYSLDVLKMVASGVLVDQIIAHSNPPGELVNISHELKRMASEINDRWVKQPQKTDFGQTTAC